MKNLTILLAVLSLGTWPLIGQESSVSTTGVEQSVVAQQKLGSMAILEIRKGYENGEYDSFLKELDDSYLAAREKNQLEQLIEMREGISSDWEKWDREAKKIQEQRGRELLAAMENEEDSLLKDKVLSTTAKVMTEEQDEALAHLITFRHMAPGTGKNSDENKLIDLDLEYEYKSLHIGMPGKVASEQKEQQMVLRMEKARKMVALSTTFKDPLLKKEMGLYVQNLDQRLAQSWDVIDLNSLAHRTEKPASVTEEKVISILNQYQEKFSDLAQQLLAEDESE
jgi:hypothetical protein